jgi:hypothetical protein
LFRPLPVPEVISEDLPDDEISALKDRVKKLENPDTELVSTICKIGLVSMSYNVAIFNV